jgi:hypothetical protein
MGIITVNHMYYEGKARMREAQNNIYHQLRLTSSRSFSNPSDMNPKGVKAFSILYEIHVFLIIFNTSLTY